MAWIKAIKEEDIEKLVEYLRGEQFEVAGGLFRKFLSDIEVVEPMNEPVPKQYITIKRKKYEILSVKDAEFVRRFQCSMYLNGVIEILSLKRKGIIYTTFKYSTEENYSEPLAFTL